MQRGVDLYNDRIQRDAGSLFGKQGSNLGARGLLSSSSLSNLGQNLSDDAAQSLGEFQNARESHGLNLFAKTQEDMLNRQLDADDRFLGRGIQDHGATTGRELTKQSGFLNTGVDDYNRRADRQLQSDSNFLHQGIGDYRDTADRQAKTDLNFVGQGQQDLSLF